MHGLRAQIDVNMHRGVGDAIEAEPRGHGGEGIVILRILNASDAIASRSAPK
jgi:hypothetical protein